MIEFRHYRNQFSQQRFVSFTVNYKDTDLWIGVDPLSYHPNMEKLAFDKVKRLRHLLEDYLLKDPDFGKSLVPCSISGKAPHIAKTMAQAAKAAQVGPMAAVAGAFAQSVGQELLSAFKINELVLENGGDIFLKLEKDLLMSVYAGNSPLSEKVAVNIPFIETPLGICTSSGTVGPSLSFGKADAATIVCKCAALADAYATAIGNLIKTKEDIDFTIKKTAQFSDILAAIIVCDDKLGIRSTFEIKFLNEI